MSLRSGGKRLARRALSQIGAPHIDLPAFLCPGLITYPRNRLTYTISLHQRKLHTIRNETSFSPPKPAENSTRTTATGSPSLLSRLPPQCSGCGALTQTIDKDEPGYFDVNRKSIKQFLAGTSHDYASQSDKVVEQAIQRAAENDSELARQLGIISHMSRQKIVSHNEVPLCDRCHTLKHHETGVSIHHPSIQSIEDTIFESPYKYNHVYHVVDAADFPMSLIPGLHKLLDITPQRSLNRRSKTGRFYHGKKTEVSFIITRSDLLAPKKEQVDHMLPYLRSVLRDALGRAAADARLGNLRCVSAKRGWWTKELKEDIWTRGGGGWMVGKVNVGKSQLFHEVFPKGRRGKVEKGKPLASEVVLDEGTLVSMKPMSFDDDNSNRITALHGGDVISDRQPVAAVAVSPEGDIESQKLAISTTATSFGLTSGEKSSTETQLLAATELDEHYLDDETFDTYSLLPPAQIETDYPAMPLVSALPGTTASPIRVPFGNGKGELIDLPGLSRGDLELHVQPEHRPTLVMRSRIRPEQQVIKPGQSLLLGGFIRITPTTPDVIFLAYSFNPLHPHLTSTEKAVGTQTQTRESNIENISVPGTGKTIATAGAFHLKWDVTKERTGPITARDAAGIEVDRLPFRVMSADILIEGCGWVELTAQIRKRPEELLGSLGRSRLVDPPNDYEQENEMKEDIDPQWPTVEVFSPNGKFIAARRPMNAWVNFAEKPSEKKAGSRPRRSMKGMKKLVKQRSRS